MELFAPEQAASDNHRRKTKQVVVQEEQNSKMSKREHNLRNDDTRREGSLRALLERVEVAPTHSIKGANQSSSTLFNGHCCGKAAKRWEYLWKNVFMKTPSSRGIRNVCTWNTAMP